MSWLFMLCCSAFVVLCCCRVMLWVMCGVLVVCTRAHRVRVMCSCSWYGRGVFAEWSRARGVRVIDVFVVCSCPWC